MAITLKGIRLESIAIERNKENGKTELQSAAYSLISSTDHVLANQRIGQYGEGGAITASFDTLALMDKFIESYKKDLTNTLGLEA